MAKRKSKISPIVVGVAGTAIVGGTAIAAKLLSKKRNRTKLKKMANEIMEEGEEVKKVISNVKKKSRSLTQKAKKKLKA